MTSAPNFLDLDALEAPLKVKIKINDVIHELKPVTVQSFVTNIKLVQSLGSTSDIEAEMATMKKILLAAFPTLDEEKDLNEMRLDQLQALTDYAMQHNGQKPAEAQVVEEATAKGAENPQ